LNNLTGSVIVTGTANQVSVASSSGQLVFSLPSTVSFPGTVANPNVTSSLWYGTSTGGVVPLALGTNLSITSGTLNASTSGGASQWTTTSAGIAYNGGNVAVGTTCPTNSASGSVCGVGIAALGSFIPPITTVASLPAQSFVIGTNLFSTQNLSSGSWGPAGVTITSGESDPTGGSNAYLISQTSATGNHYLYQSPTLSVGSKYVLAAWVKPANLTTFTFDFAFTGADTFATFQLTGNGSVSSVPSGASATITAGTGAASGWYYVTETATPTASVPWIILCPDASACSTSGAGLNEAVTYVYAPVVGLFVASSSPVAGDMMEVTDALNGQDCTVGNGGVSLVRTLCVWSGANWAPAIPSSSVASSGSNNTSTASQLIYVGDSLTAGLDGTYPPSYYVNPTWTFTQTNQGISGQTLQTMASTTATKVVPLYTPLAAYNIVSVWGGINDIVGGATANQVFG
jgi:hypothetical protein